MHQAGIPAFSFTGGAGYVPRGAGRTVADAGVQAVHVVYDLDQPGRDGATKAAAELRGAGLSVTVRQLPAKLGEHADVTDLYRLRDFDDAALVAALEALPEADAETSPDAEELPRAIPVSDVVPGEPVTWVVEGLFPAGEIIIPAGDGGSGKTTAVIGALGAIAAGAPAFDRFPTKGGPVLYVSEEDGAEIIRNRLEALVAGHGWDAALVGQRFHILAQAGCTLDSAEWQAHLFAEVERTGAVAVALDPLAELTLAPENSNDDAKLVVRFLRALGSETGAAIILVHHAGKAVEGKRKVDRVRGASAYVAAARAVFFMDPHEEGIAVETVKFNRGARPDPFVIGRTVDAEPRNPAIWNSATLRFLTAAVAKDHSADAFVIRHLEAEGSLNTTQLKELAKAEPGISGEDVSKSIKKLKIFNRIEHEKGPNNSKLWRLVSGCQQSPATPATQLAELADTCPASVEEAPTVATLYEGATGAGDSGNPATQTHPCTTCGRFSFSRPDARCFQCRKSQDGEAA
jgi:hypothetical protein